MILPEFNPQLTPKEMLELGVFEGKYLNKTRNEYPSEWFENAKLSDIADPSVNLFQVKSRQPLSVWKANGWIREQDPLGWFQWYCRFFLGRRTEDDYRQINRHRAFVRHSGQVRKNGNSDITKRVIQRQALVNWSHDPFCDFETLACESIHHKITRILQDQIPV